LSEIEYSRSPVRQYETRCHQSVHGSSHQPDHDV